MSADDAIVVADVTKEFRIRQAGTLTVKSAVIERFVGSRRYHRTLKALDSVSFRAKRGETLGIIGANGAGKSTLLSLITGTIEPTSGTISTTGSVSSLLELGAGFHPELTGRENIFLYGAIMGMSRDKMLERFDSIVDFAGLAEFIDQPVKHYSSGMYVRLGFAVAVEVDPDILLIDEVLAVGDESFQRKCIAKMEEFRRSGKTMLIISHDIPTIQRISDRILFLDHGKVAGLGEPTEIARGYRAASREKLAKSSAREWGTGDAKITNVKISGSKGEAGEFTYGSALSLQIEYETAKPIDSPVFGVAIKDIKGATMFGTNTQIEGVTIQRIDGPGKVSIEFPSLSLAGGTYLLSFSIHSADHRTNYHRIDNRYPISVKAEQGFEGVHMATQWSVS